MDDDEMEVHAALGRGVLFWAVVLTVVAAGVTTFWLYMRPRWNDMERRADVASPQYVEARRAEIIVDMQRSAELDTQIAENKDDTQVVAGLESQRRALSRKIKAALAKIPRDAWPQGAGEFQ